MAKSLTPIEKQMLEKVGWKEGDEIPENLQALLGGLPVEGAEAKPVEEEVLSSTEPAEKSPAPSGVEAIDNADLSAEEREKLYADLQAMGKQQPVAEEQPRPDRRTQIPPAVPNVVNPADFAPGVGEALQAIQTLEDSKPAPSEPAPEPVAAPEESDSAGVPELLSCPHCAWPLDLPDVPEPDVVERQAFIQSVLGLKPFPKQYSLLGGAVRVTFRTLTAREIDAVYAQAFAEQQTKDVRTSEDFWERINRLRMFLQLISVESSTFQHNLPQGLSKETNSVAESYWEDEAEIGNVFKTMEDKLLTEIIPTETMSRMVTNTCGRFNRLVSKMEAMVDRSDFWEATEAPAY